MLSNDHFPTPASLSSPTTSFPVPLPPLPPPSLFRHAAHVVRRSPPIPAPPRSPDHVVDEANGAGGARPQRSGADGVDAHLVLAASLVGQHAGVGLQGLWEQPQQRQQQQQQQELRHGDPERGRDLGVAPRLRPSLRVHQNPGLVGNCLAAASTGPARARGSTLWPLPCASQPRTPLRSCLPPFSPLLPTPPPPRPYAVESILALSSTASWPHAPRAQQLLTPPAPSPAMNRVPIRLLFPPVFSIAQGECRVSLGFMLSQLCGHAPVAQPLFKAPGLAFQKHCAYAPCPQLKYHTPCLFNMLPPLAPHALPTAVNSRYIPTTPRHAAERRSVSSYHPVCPVRPPTRSPSSSSFRSDPDLGPAIQCYGGNMPTCEPISLGSAPNNPRASSFPGTPHALPSAPLSRPTPPTPG